MLYGIDKKKPNLKKKILRPFVVDVNPNIVTGLALLSAFVAGAMFYSQHLILALFFVLVNGFLDILDGEIARVKKRSTRLGDFLDHTADRLSDVAIFLGIAMSPYVIGLFGYLLIIMMLLVSYLGTQAHALLKTREYGGLLGRSDRLTLVIIFGAMNLIYPNMLYYCVLIILTLSTLTFIQRFFKIYKELK